MDESLERLPLPAAAQHHHSEEKQRFQFPTHEVKPLMPSRSSLHDAGDLEMDSFNPSEPQSAAIHRPLRRSEGIPKFQFPTHDVRPQMPPRRMESDVLDMDDYGLREPQSSFRQPVHIDEPLRPFVPRRVEGKQGFQFPSYDMRSAPLPSPAGRLRRSDQYDNSDVDMMNGFGVERPGSSIHDVAPTDYSVYHQRHEERSRYEGYEGETFLTPRPVRESGMMQMNDQGFYRPLPAASSIRQSKVERRSSLHEESVQMGMVPPPMTLPTALPRRARDKLPFEESSASLYSDRTERRTLPLYFLRKTEPKKKAERKAAQQVIPRERSRENRKKKGKRPSLHCDFCEIKFENKAALAKHSKLDSHKKNFILFKETLANIKNSEGDDDVEFDDEVAYLEESIGVKNIKIHCNLCKMTFRKKSIYVQHLAFKRHKLKARIIQSLKKTKGDRDQLSPDNPLGSFFHYINSDTQTTLLGEKEERNVTLVKSKENLFCLKFLDLRHLLSEEPGPVGEEYLEELDVSASSRDKRSYRCSLCNENITGVDNSEKHLYSVSHQEVFKKNVNPDWELQIPLKSSSSYFHVLMDLWGVCKDKYKTELSKCKETASCICGCKIQRFNDYKRHFRKAFVPPPPNLPTKNSQGYAEGKEKWMIMNHRIAFRECMNLIKLFTLPEDVIVAKRKSAMELVGDTTDETPADGDTATTETTTAASSAAADAVGGTTSNTTTTTPPSVKMDESVKKEEEEQAATAAEEAVNAMKQEASN
uniref:C2H2-type domain-containing protein n=1 Tax=Trichobilharzia regenti TaxID=157069 RepID=A0AA85J5J5_TRIRE|nr:unnamed protein product [Trichobilharzia regenti]